MKPLFCILSCLLWASAVSSAEILIQDTSANQPHSFQLPDNSRLEIALAKIDHPQLVYWPASRITNAEQDRLITQEQQSVQQALSSVLLTAEQFHDSELAYNSRLMLQLVSQLTVAGRLNVNLDPDWVRIRTEANPLLVGKYRILLGLHQPQVRIYGLIAGPTDVPLLHGQGVASYLEGRAIFEGAESRSVFLCQPDGRVQQVPIAYWNKKHREPMPGAALLVGFAEGSLPERYADLNVRIAKLIAARITL
jgi:hypothetical protein